jgi:hypothetical protein
MIRQISIFNMAEVFQAFRVVQSVEVLNCKAFITRLTRLSFRVVALPWLRGIGFQPVVMLFFGSYCLRIKPFAPVVFRVAKHPQNVLGDESTPSSIRRRCYLPFLSTSSYDVVGYGGHFT